MSKIKGIQIKFYAMGNTITRFPVTAGFVLLMMLSNMYSLYISSDDFFVERLLTFTFGGLVSLIFQMVYEKKQTLVRNRIILYGVPIILATAYYILINNSGISLVEFDLRTMVIFLIFIIAFLWIPSINSEISFNDTVMAAFKAFSSALLYSLVLLMGLLLSVLAFSGLIYSVDFDVYLHIINIVMVFYLPIHFLSLIPRYHEKLEEDGISSELEQDIMVPKFLSNLITYVIIPVTAVITIILLLYIIINLKGEFWTDNLLEPLLISYSIVVIFVYLLSSKLDNKLAKTFRIVFPKVLIPIVLFQTLSSILLIEDKGITYGRYFVIAFGIFATIAGILFSFFPVKRNGIIAPILIGFAIISILNPIDAFTIGRNSQANRVKKILLENDMLSENQIIKNTNISKEDRADLFQSLRYLERLEYIERYSWLQDYIEGDKNDMIFGFDRYDYVQTEKYTNYYLPYDMMIPISGYNYMLEHRIDSQMEMESMLSFSYNKRMYQLVMEGGDNSSIVLRDVFDSNSIEMIRFSIDDIFKRYEEGVVTPEELTLDNAIFEVSNDTVTLTIIVKSAHITQWEDDYVINAEVLTLIKFK